MKVLSTKKLTLAQRELLLNGGLGFVEYDGLKIEPIAVPDLQIEDHIIITSKNAFRSIKDSHHWDTLKEKNWWVVGERTTAELQKNDLKINAVGLNSVDLAQKIIEKSPETRFTYFTGNMRREELPELLSEHSVDFKEYIVYNTVMTPKKFNTVFDGILFFSPSGVDSYVMENTIENEVCFCIGNTTATEAKKYTNNIVKANKASVENVIVQAVKYFKKR
ncbi:uroporphyrinogen-III synthase [Flavobacteriaceae bacterium R38]|nr:uroporphyrinogen-III synthase [Flavobacteriaceae bacterium R38]